MASTRNLIFIVHDIVNMVQYNIQNSKWKNISFTGDMDNLNSTEIFAKISSATKLNKIKAMVFTIMDLCFPSLAEAYAFRLKCLDFCKSNGITYFYIPVSSIIAFSVMSKAKVMVEEGEEVIIVCPSQMSAQIYSNLLLRKKDHYQVIRFSTDYDLSLSQQWKNNLIKNAKPKKTILMRLTPMDSVPFLQQCAKLFQNAVTISNDSHFGNIHDAIVEKVMHVMGDKITPYDVTIQCQSRIAVFLENVEIITVEYVKALPFEQSVIIDVDPSKVLLLVGSSQAPKDNPIVFQEIPLSTFKSQKVKVSLKIDICSFHDIHVEPFDGNTALNNPLSTVCDKARLVFDKQHFTVFVKKNDEEQKITTADGFDKTPIYIAFTEEKPIVGKRAAEAYADNPELVVFDLIKLCSISNADVSSPKWRFNLAMENNSVMVAVETVEGKRRSSVEFLLALVLKHGLQIVKNECGKKMEQLEIEFNGFTPNDILKKNFVDAGKLIKTDIVFV